MSAGEMLGSCRAASSRALITSTDGGPAASLTTFMVGDRGKKSPNSYLNFFLLAACILCSFHCVPQKRACLLPPLHPPARSCRQQKVFAFPSSPVFLLLQHLLAQPLLQPWLSWWPLLDSAQSVYICLVPGWTLHSREAERERRDPIPCPPGCVPTGLWLALGRTHH